MKLLKIDEKLKFRREMVFIKQAFLIGSNDKYDTITHGVSCDFSTTLP
jgi:hypothetical protein